MWLLFLLFILFLIKFNEKDVFVVVTTKQNYQVGILLLFDDFSNYDASFEKLKENVLKYRNNSKFDIITDRYEIMLELEPYLTITDDIVDIQNLYSFENYEVIIAMSYHKFLENYNGIIIKSETEYCEKDFEVYVVNCYNNFNILNSKSLERLSSRYSYFYDFMFEYLYDFFGFTENFERSDLMVLIPYVGLHEHCFDHFDEICYDKVIDDYYYWLNYNINILILPLLNNFSYKEYSKFVLRAGPNFFKCQTIFNREEFEEVQVNEYYKDMKFENIQLQKKFEKFEQDVFKGYNDKFDIFRY